MPKPRRKKQFTAVEVANALRESSEYMLRLADQVSDEGHRLTHDEKENVRVALLSWVKEYTHELQIAYLTGAPQDHLVRAFESIMFLSERITDL